MDKITHIRIEVNQKGIQTTLTEWDCKDCMTIYKLSKTYKDETVAKKHIWKDVLDSICFESDDYPNSISASVFTDTKNTEQYKSEIILKLRNRISEKLFSANSIKLLSGTDPKSV